MKINKYVVKATAQTLGYFAFAAVVGMITAEVLLYIQPTATQVIGTLLAGFCLFATYNMIKIQAGILESQDKIKESLKNK